jgi:hypothetical protein
LFIAALTRLFSSPYILASSIVGNDKAVWDVCTGFCYELGRFDSPAMNCPIADHCNFVFYKPSLNLIIFGKHFSLNFSMRAGPNGAAPPVTATTLDKWDDFTAG